MKSDQRRKTTTRADVKLREKPADMYLMTQHERKMKLFAIAYQTPHAPIKLMAIASQSKGLISPRQSNPPERVVSPEKKGSAENHFPFAPVARNFLLLSRVRRVRMVCFSNFVKCKCFEACKLKSSLKSMTKRRES